MDNLEQLELVTDGFLVRARADGVRLDLGGIGKGYAVDRVNSAKGDVVLFDEVLADTTDPVVMGEKWERKYAEDEWYRHLYRTGNAYHGVHPFYMWYWGSHGMKHVGKVIIVGGDAPTVRKLGFTPASTMNDAFEIASDTVGRSPSITHIKTPPLMIADVK